MTSELRDMINEAIAADDEARQAYEKPLPQLKQRHAAELRYKTRDDAVIEELPTAVAESEFESALLALADEAGASAGQLERRIIALEQEVRELRGEIRASKNVLPLRGGRDAAA
jgi:hypothetical protein